MLFLIEFALIIGLVVAGCWTRASTAVFLPLITLALVLFAIRIGHPVGLLASFGGWLILDLMLAVAALGAHLVALVAKTLERLNR